MAGPSLLVIVGGCPECLLIGEDGASFRAIVEDEPFFVTADGGPSLAGTIEGGHEPLQVVDGDLAIVEDGRSRLGVDEGRSTTSLLGVVEDEFSLLTILVGGPVGLGKVERVPALLGLLEGGPVFWGAVGVPPLLEIFDEVFVLLEFEGITVGGEEPLAV